MKRTLTSIAILLLAVINSACTTQPEKTQTAQKIDKPSLPAEPAVDDKTNIIEQITVSEESPPSNDLWQYVRDDFTLSNTRHRRIDQFIPLFARQHHIDRLNKRAQRYLHFIVSELKQRNMPLELALLPGIESAYRAHAYSPAGAAGLWQFMKATGKRYGLHNSWWYDGRRDVVASTRAALDYLDWLHRRFDNDWLLALAAYNAGEGRVGQAIRKNKKRNRPTDFWSLDLPRETKNYIPQWLALVKIIDTPEQYGIHLTPIDNQAVFAVTNIEGQLDLQLAAKLADINIDELKKLNPGFKQWATDPNGPHHLCIPVAKVNSFQEQLAQIDNKQRVTWKRYTIRPGDVLGTIARRYHTDVSVIKRANNLRRSTIRAGHYLMIPVSDHGLAAPVLAQAVVSTNTAPSTMSYRVRNGDSLWKIARSWQISVADLKKWNPGISNNLQLGQKLNIQSATSNSQMHYKVRKGDSLYLIAKRFNVKINELQNWNSLNKKYLQPGQKLTLYIQ